MSTTNNRKLNRLLGGRGRNRTEVDASAVLLNLIESGKISVAEAKEAAHAVKNCIDVIDLCDDGNDDEQQSDDSKSDITAAATGAATITTEIKAEDEQTVCDNESPEPDESSQQILKPLYEKGDSVYAKWEGNDNWFPGTIQSYTINDCKSRYGESRTYRIKFDDGDEGDCEDYNVFHHRDYLINNERKEGTWKGVKTVRDKSSSDEWAKLVGWYVVNTADGKTLTFSKLVSAMQAYDKSVIKQKGSETKGYELNLPEDYPEVGVNAVTPMAETGGERESKRRKIGVVDQHDSFWAENKTEVGITEEAFMDKSKGIFLLNSGVNSTKKRNQDFGVFVSKGIATPGFDYVPHDIIPQIASLPQDELRKQLSQNNEFCNWMEGTTTEKRSSAARQVAMWLKRATVGSFVVMRHEYERCRFCPKWLKNESGEYIGPVYIIGVITKKIIPCSGEEERLACKISDPCSNLCLVDWIRMGFKKDLSKATTSYISKVCQPTVNQICHAYDKVYQGGATALSVRRDLWQNANSFVLPVDKSQSLQKSCLVTRTRLACLTGGKVNKHQYGNPLNVGTPVTYCGGAAIATKNGKVHHICIKEEMNCPYPSTYTEQFVVYRKAPSPENSGRQQKDVQLLIQAHPNHPPIPIFWEPTDQIGSAVMYIGHWTIAQIEDLKDRAEKYLGYYRCAKLYFDFHHFDERWEKVIRLCHDKSHEQIKELDFRGI